MFDFKDKVIIVTGASGNLGQAVARAFHAAEAHLVLVDRSAERLAGLYADLAADHAHYLAGSVDVNDAASVQGMVQEAVHRFERVDVLVSAVGGYRVGTPVHETPLDVWDELFSLNARTAFIASQAVVPQMLRQRSGKIINIAARSGLAGKANVAAHSASKAAVIRLTESLSAELRDFGINVNCIVPGTIDTPQNRQAMPEADTGRWVAPESLADVILFLASDAARDVHGASLPVLGRS